MGEPARTSRKGRSSKADQVIVALLQHSSLEKAAAALGVSHVTLWRWMQKEEFQQAYRKARRDTFSQSVARLQHASSAAVSALLRVMCDQNTPASSRVRAADCVLEKGLRAMELEDLDARIQRLEKADKHPE